MKISPYKFVAVSYQLYVGEGAERDLIEETVPDQPMTYISGTGLMLDAFEKNLSGLSVGDLFDFKIPAEEAYGKYDDGKVIDLPKELFEIDGVFDDEKVYEDAVIPMMDSDGDRLTGTVVSVVDDVVVMDFNHPLAGEELHFSGKVEVVRDAAEEEIQFALNPQGGGCNNCNGGSCGDGCSY
ncbi:MAG: FKBP-type peptidyl-prolyl cis-trans isomerase [Candidatus Azobacteroides sp.]|nr:FKBP-type peptidyl-prolyl cis-trans isomerase [Candidatus Azobacteroides sp.]